MKKLQYFASVFGVALFAASVAAPVMAQGSSLDFGRGNSIRVTPNGTTFGMNGNTVNIGNSGGRISGSGGSFSWGNGTQNSSMGRTYDLDPAYPSHGMRYAEPPAGAFGPGAGGNQFNSSGTQGEMGRSSAYTPGELTDSDRGLHDYLGNTDGKQTPMSRGGLPETTTAVQAFDNIYGMTRIPSGQFRYGFGNYGPALLKSPTGFGSQGFGGFLPQTSTGSLDINTVDR